MAHENVEAQPTTHARGSRRFTPGGLIASLSHAMAARRWLVLKIMLAAAVIVAALVLFHGSVGAAFLLGLFVASVTQLVDGRLSIVLGLVCLACSPILPIAEQHAWLQRSTLVNYYAANLGLYSLKGAADTVASWAYYFLCVGVAAQIVRYVGRERRRNDE